MSSTSYQFEMSGGYTVQPLDGDQSFAPNITALIDNPHIFDKKMDTDLDLNVDTAVSVPFGGVVNANVVILKVVSAPGPVTAQVTWANGSSQALPVDSTLVLESNGFPITAISLTRTPATPTTVRVFLGENA